MMIVLLEKVGFMKEREQFKSRIGFILLSAGCAIGIGKCLEISLCSRRKWWGNLCIVLFVFPSFNWCSNIEYGIFSW